MANEVYINPGLQPTRDPDIAHVVNSAYQYAGLGPKRAEAAAGGVVPQIWHHMTKCRER